MAERRPQPEDNARRLRPEPPASKRDGVVEPKRGAPVSPPLNAIAPALAGAAASFEPDLFSTVHAAMLARTNVETMRPRDVDAPRTFALDRMQALVEALGNPQGSYRVVHVAGSKGKGSVCEMTASALHGCGCAVGLYTSPHLLDVRERIRINHRPITPEEFGVLGRRVLEAADSLPKKLGAATYFELLTAMALLHFAEQAVDIAVIEVGMGGLMDATNVVKPDVAVVTSVQLEHTEVLGDSLDKIAGHKGGIFKSAIPSLTAVQDPEVLETLRACADAAGSALSVLAQSGLDFSYRFESSPELGPHFKVSLLTPTSVFEHVPVPLKGEPQTWNCGLVLAIIDRLRQAGLDLPDARVSEGLAKTPANGRLEIIHREPRIVIDGAHTKESVQALVRAVGSQMKYDSLVVVFGCHADKDLVGMLGAMSMGADKIIFTRASGNQRAADPRDLQRKFNEISGKMSQLAPTVKEAINTAARAVGRGDLILVTGSFAIAGEAKALLLEKQRATTGAR